MKDDKTKLQELKKAAVNLCKSAREAMPLIYGTQKRPLGKAIADFNKAIKQLGIEDEDS